MLFLYTVHGYQDPRMPSESQIESRETVQDKQVCLGMILLGMAHRVTRVMSVMHTTMLVLHLFVVCNGELSAYNRS